MERGILQRYGFGTAVGFVTNPKNVKIFLMLIFSYKKLGSNSCIILSKSARLLLIFLKYFLTHIFLYRHKGLLHADRGERRFRNVKSHFYLKRFLKHCKIALIAGSYWRLTNDHALQMKGRWESNINVWFPFMYSQKWHCCFQNIYLWEIYIFPGSVCLFCRRDRSWKYINLSQTHECGNWDWGQAMPRKKIHKWDFPCSEGPVVGSLWSPIGAQLKAMEAHLELFKLTLRA